MCPNGSFHLAAVDTTITSEVEEDGLVVGFGIGHTLLIVLKVQGFFLTEYEVLRLHRRCKSTDGLAGSTPEARYHVEGKGEGNERQEETSDGSACVRHHLTHLVVLFLVMWETKPSDEIGTQQGKDDNPKGEEHLAVENVPSVSQVGHREELEREGQFQETQRNFDAVHPVATLRGCFQP